MPNSESEEGIFASLSCGNGMSFSGCFILLNSEDMNKIKYPWLRIYNKPLPPTGEYKFIPPITWKQNASPVRGINHGYLDVNGHEWIWDMLHQNHWDVQDGTPYKNVTPDGRIL
jgi:hypothetical protein